VGVVTLWCNDEIARRALEHEVVRISINTLE